MVPFRGVSETLFSLCIVAPWLPNGNILDYVRKNQRVNRLQVVSDSRWHSQESRGKILRQLADAACGLECLHSLSIIHGNVNPVGVPGFPG